jgi:putative component of membrane protein insertase Oxa1/YidC/SpoIIIJ protein YidD
MVLNSIKHCIRSFFEGIPVFQAGILLFFLGGVLSAKSGTELVRVLINEQDWPHCRVESLRVLAVDPSNNWAAYGALISNWHLGRQKKQSLDDLQLLATATTNAEIRARSHLAVGLGAWEFGDQEAAISNLYQVLSVMPDPAVARQAGCALYVLLREYPDAGAAWPGLADQLAVMRGGWTREDERNCRPREKVAPSWWSWPGRMIVWGYRSQISPAIGSRCSLQPSCSEYFRQACSKHGLLGFAMYGDRGVREPAVVSAGKHPVRVGDKVKYPDPLSDHDWWMEP